MSTQVKPTLTVWHLCIFECEVSFESLILLLYRLKCCVRVSRGWLYALFLFALHNLSGLRMMYTCQQVEIFLCVFCFYPLDLQNLKDIL